MYPQYEIPPATGVTWSTDGGRTFQQFPDNYRCTQEDAELIVKATGGVLSNAAITAPPNIIIKGVSPGDTFQPWYVTGPLATGFIGPAVQIMWAYNGVNGGGKGNPGTWSGIGTGNVKYNPTAPPVAPAPPPVDSSGDPAAWATSQNAGQGFTIQDRSELLDIRRLVVALAKLQNIS